ncbi:hypothetical protein ACFYSC_15185 [Streptosporangium sp. NPDC004379]|uniref:hypothetical protein n=1 Tax=Streptosporangium sp. NPDC004379 TaxID=3366189 RepID=UPI0036841FF1
MSTSPGAGRAVLGPGQAAAWVGEHGAHLIDYAARHLPPTRAMAAAASALAACRSGPAPRGVTPRGRLLAFLRRECRISPGYRAGYVPEADMPGMPERRLIERAWTIVDPLGAEALRLMYRHELTTEDLAHALSISVEEVPGLTTRTQDLIETLVSGLDALAHRRSTCRDLAPLAERVFPGEGTVPPAAEFAEAREDLLSHMVRCTVCTRPINIRYTVPQMISHPRVTPLTDEVRQRLLDSLRPATRPPAPRTASAPPSPGGGTATPTAGATPTASTTGTAGVTPTASTTPAAPTAPTAPAVPMPAPTPPAAPAAPAVPAVSGTPATPPPAETAGTDAAGPGPASRSQEDTMPGIAVRRPRPGRARPPYMPAGPERQQADRAAPRADRTAPYPDRTTPRADRAAPYPARQDRSRNPYRPVLPDSSATTPPSPPKARPPSPPPPTPGQDTPLYNALLSQSRARETREQDAAATVPSMPAITRRTPPGGRGARAGTGSGTHDGHDGPDDGPEGIRFGAGVRFAEAMSWAGRRFRTTTIKVIIVAVAGTAGTLAGMSLLGPVIGTEDPAGPLQSSAATGPETAPSTADGTAPAVSGGLAGRLRVPPVVTLDEFGQGSLLLTLTGEPLEWRISAPGLAVTPSSGTLRQGQTGVIVLRALRVRQWCGVPASVSAPLTVFGPDDSVTTTVRWRTC